MPRKKTTNVAQPKVAPPRPASQPNHSPVEEGKPIESEDVTPIEVEPQDEEITEPVVDDAIPVDQSRVDRIIEIMAESKPVAPPAHWEFDPVQTDGTLTARDPAGWFTARINPDGSAVIQMLGHPNLHNRPEGYGPCGDDTFIRVPNLCDFVERMMDLCENPHLFVPPSA